MQGRLPAHAHAAPHACIVVRGTFTDAAWNGGRAAAAPGDIRVHERGAEHSIDVASDGLACAVIELAGLREGVAQEGRLERAQGKIARIFDELETFNPARRLRLQHEFVAEVSASLSRSRSPALMGDADAAGAATMLEEGAAVASVARAAGVHRATFTRMFRNAYGLAPEAYRMLVRLERAADLLASGASASAAAIEAGFFDQPHFNRAWRGRFGGTPARWAQRAATIVQDRRDFCP